VHHQCHFSLLACNIASFWFFALIAFEITFAIAIGSGAFLYASSTPFNTFLGHPDKARY
jgi:hypothetical protein